MSKQSRQSRKYEESSTSVGLQSPADVDYVAGRVQERADAKRSRDYELADSIRDELVDEYNVVIDDRLMKWSVGGDFAGDGGSKRKDAYTRRGGGGDDLTEDDLASIASMVAARAKAKRDRNYEDADELRDTLREKYNVKVDDRNKEWQIETGDYAQEPRQYGERVLTDEEVKIVQQKLLDRVAARRERNFAAADAIRDELASVYSVVINDRTISWKTASTMPDDDDYFVESNNDALGSTEDALTDISNDLEETIATQMNAADDGDDSSPSATSDDDLSSLTIVELKEKLREAGLPVSGNKSELIGRLLE